MGVTPGARPGTLDAGGTATLVAPAAAPTAVLATGRGSLPSSSATCGADGVA